jgi:hypothetical protein
MGEGARVQAPPPTGGICKKGCPFCTKNKDGRERARVPVRLSGALGVAHAAWGWYIFNSRARGRAPLLPPPLYICKNQVKGLHQEKRVFFIICIEEL